MTVFEAVIRLSDEGYSFMASGGSVLVKRPRRTCTGEEKTFLQMIAGQQADAVLAITALPNLRIASFTQGNLELARLNVIKIMQTEGYIRIIRVVYHRKAMTVDLVYTPTKDEAFSVRVFKSIGGEIIEPKAKGQPWRA